jgi:hypothetical protein
MAKDPEGMPTREAYLLLITKFFTLLFITLQYVASAFLLKGLVEMIIFITLIFKFKLSSGLEDRLMTARSRQQDDKVKEI